MVENDNLLTKLKRDYATLSKGQKQIAAYILENYDRAAFITASKMGQIVGVSESTVVRFAYVMGYDGYPELQRSLQELIRTKLTAIQRVRLTSELDEDDVLRTILKADMHNIRATIESADNTAFTGAVRAILEARKIYIVGMRSALPLAQFLSYYLGFACDNVMMVNSFVSDAAEQLIRISESDVCIGISFPRYSSRTVDALRFARERGAKTIAITDNAASPLVPLSGYTLTAHSDMASFADSLVAPLSLINAIIVAVGLARKDELEEHFSKLENIWGMQQVYVTKSQGGDEE